MDQQTATQFRVSHRHKTTLAVDGQQLRITIKRQTIEERSAFNRAKHRTANPESERRLLLRKLPDEFERVTPTEAEQEKAAEALRELEALETQAKTILAGMPADDQNAPLAGIVGALMGFAATAARQMMPEERYRISDEEVMRRRRSELTPEEAEELRLLEDAEDLDTARFFSEAIGSYLRVEKGQIIIEEEDGTETDVQTGAEFMRVFGSRVEIVRSAVSAIWRENVLSEALKNAWRPASVSIASSSDREPASHGQKLETPAAAAVSEASASSGAAMESSETTAIK